ncbi:hypothetical protein DFQ26_008258 [Actinomortierella ambigua]|nr:hypothetical protein DFQ26_008258 [Actinomortierella ambigua]
MSGLQFGLNVKAKKGLGASALSRPSKPTVSKTRPSVFGADADNDDDDDLDNDHGALAFAKSGSKPPTLSSTITTTTTTTTTTATPTAAAATSNNAVNRSLRAYAQSTTQSLSVIEQQNAALAQDATVFDYDGVYDQLKTGERLKALVRKQEAAAGQSRYIESMLRSREQRQLDQQLAQEKKLERERQAEGEMYADKDQFVTPAYKAQKEAARLAEEEEQKREEELAKDKDGKRMQGFYRHMLNEQTRLRPGGGVSGALDEDEEALAKKLGLKNAHEGLKLTEATADLDRDKEEKEQIAKARAEGLKVVVNDDGQVVDKRDLLKAGLNVFKSKEPTSFRGKSSSSTSSPSGRERDRDRRDYRDQDRDRDRRSGGGSSNSYRDSRGGRDRPSSRETPDERQRSRMTEQIESQLLDQEKQRQQEEKERQDSIREALKRKNQDDQVMDAKARYLARKKAAADAAAAGGGTDSGA